VVLRAEEREGDMQLFLSTLTKDKVLRFNPGADFGSAPSIQNGGVLKICTYLAQKTLLHLQTI